MTEQQIITRFIAYCFTGGSLLLATDKWIPGMMERVGAWVLATLLGLSLIACFAITLHDIIRAIRYALQKGERSNARHKP